MILQHLPNYFLPVSSVWLFLTFSNFNCVWWAASSVVAHWIMSVQYTGGCSVWQRLSWVQWVDIMSILGVFSWLGDIMNTLGEYHDKCGGIRMETSVYWTPPVYSVISPQCTEHAPVYCTPPGVLHRHFAGWVTWFRVMVQKIIQARDPLLPGRSR